MNLIKIQNNTATREPIPQALRGLQPESLLDLSWTDPQLELQDCAWWPEDDQSLPLPPLHKYGEETLTIDPVTQTVITTKAVVPFDEQDLSEWRSQMQVTPLEGMLAIEAAGISAQFDAWASAPERTFAERAFLNKAQIWKRNDTVLIAGAGVVGITEAQLDQMFLAIYAQRQAE